jgi:hypothetical protein
MPPPYVRGIVRFDLAPGTPDTYVPAGSNEMEDIMCECGCGRVLRQPPCHCGAIYLPAGRPVYLDGEIDPQYNGTHALDKCPCSVPTAASRIELASWYDPGEPSPWRADAIARHGEPVTLADAAAEMVRLATLVHERVVQRRTAWDWVMDPEI